MARTLDELLDDFKTGGIEITLDESVMERARRPQEWLSFRSPRYAQGE